MRSLSARCPSDSARARETPVPPPEAPAGLAAAEQALRTLDLPGLEARACPKGTAPEEHGSRQFGGNGGELKVRLKVNKGAIDDRCVVAEKQSGNRRACCHKHDKSR